MPVYLHLANLIVDKAAVARKYAGGIEQFRLDYKIGEENYNQEDDELFNIARMNIDEFDIERLTSKGLHYEEEPEFSTEFVSIKYDFPILRVIFLTIDRNHCIGLRSVATFLSGALPCHLLVRLSLTAK
jgi:hypothetical protein